MCAVIFLVFPLDVLVTSRSPHSGTTQDVNQRIDEFMMRLRYAPEKDSEPIIVVGEFVIIVAFIWSYDGKSESISPTKGHSHYWRTVLNQCMSLQCQKQSEVKDVVVSPAILCCFQLTQAPQRHSLLFKWGS